MSRFAPALRRAARELDLPPTRRAAILMEMAADLEVVYEHHRRTGSSEEDAARRAEETVLGSPEVLRALGRLHRDAWREWCERTGRRLSGGVDLLLLVIGAGPMLLLAAFAVTRTLDGGVPSPSPGGGTNPLAWPLLATGLAMSAMIGIETFRVYGRERITNRGIPGLLVLAAAAPALGALGLAVGLHSVAEALAAGTTPETQLLLAERVGRDGALLLAGLLFGVAGALSSFLLLGRASVTTVREVEALLRGDVASRRDGPWNRWSGRDDVIPLVRRRQA